MTWLSDTVVEHLRDVLDWPLLPTSRYVIVDALARGGMGTVYSADDRELGRRVAVKVMSALDVGREAEARMLLEARVLARLEHPGIVPVYDVGRLSDGRFFYVMRLVNGDRLDEHAAEHSLSDRLRLFLRICEPVAFAHARGIIHRDLKPENVMVGPFGEILVMDWGVAALAGSSVDAGYESVVGTVGYMPPEQMRAGRVDVRADVYALGGVLRFLLDSGAPGRAAPHGSRALRAICAMAQASDPANRYPDVLSLSRDVERFLVGDAVSASPESAWDRAVRFARKHRTAILIVTAYLIFRVVIALVAPTR